MPLDVGRILSDSTPGCVIWSVDDFFSYPRNQNGYFIASPRFSALGVQWRLLVYPYVNIDGSIHSRLNLMKAPPYPRLPKLARFQFGIRGRDGTGLVACSGEVDATFLLPATELPRYWPWDREELAPGGVLSVFCRLRERGELLRTSATAGNDTSTQTEGLGQVSQDCVNGPSKSCNSPGTLEVVEHLKKLLSSEELCDVTLKVQKQEFKAHRALLAARSSVFRAMFCLEMSENLSNEVYITDCSPDAFRIFLRHVYTGDVEDLSMSNAFDAFFVANKYDAPGLKIQCKDYIASNITVETVCEVVAFSLLHSDSVLLEMASVFFIKHFNQIVLTIQWQCFLRDHTTAANEMIIRASKYYVPPE